ncbi:hypothetical protein ACSAZK_03800 [Methanosarcina sp. Mfa9]|uniref:hypothetical protein n=1 Tax=Methanosarcina sp. Mfa9 TaxID=3439063 RepID=UPI003F856CE0
MEKNINMETNKTVKCQVCGSMVPEDESMQENGQVLCEECYMDLKSNQGEQKKCKARKAKSKEIRY